MLIELFMLGTGFYEINAQIHARRWHELEANRDINDATIQAKLAERFEAELERRRAMSGDTKSLEEYGKIPNLYEHIRDYIYPTKEGWGAFGPDGRVKS